MDDKSIVQWRYYLVTLVGAAIAFIIIAFLFEGPMRTLFVLLAGIFAGRILPQVELLNRNSVLRILLRAVLALVIASLVFLLGFQYSRLKTSSSAAAPYPFDNGIIADFISGKGGPARSNLGTQFSLFADSAWNNQSKVWYQRIDESAGQGFLRIFYQLESAATEPYVGVYLDFSLPPPTAFDLSRFHQVAMRIKNAPSVPDAVDVAVVLYSTNVRNYDYAFPTWQIPRQNIRSEWTPVTAPFNEFKPPSFAHDNSDHDKFVLDATHVYRIAIKISAPSQSVHGSLDVHDLRFE